MAAASSRWERLHRSFERLWSKYGGLHTNKEIGLQVLREAMNPGRYSKRYIEDQIESFGLQVDLDEDWEDIALLRDGFDPLSDFGFSSTTPAESVYQTAIQVRLQRLVDSVNRHGQARWFYRGQRNHQWRTVPKILRNLASGADAEAFLEERVCAVRSIVARMMHAGLATDNFEATAIAQHYSSELGIGTWLLDVTASAWIALFFASDGGNAGDIGKLEYIELTEWTLFSNRGDSALGPIRVAAPASVLRIANQQGFFLQAPHPDLFEDLSIRTLYFLQQEGVVFENDAFEPALTRDLVYPSVDPTLAALLALPSELPDATTLTWEPTVAAVRAPGWESYLPIARALLDHEVDQRPERWEIARDFDWEDLLREICRLHATARAHYGELPKYVMTLHHLDRLIV
jgi:FRG domain